MSFDFLMYCFVFSQKSKLDSAGILYLLDTIELDSGVFFYCLGYYFINANG